MSSYPPGVTTAVIRVGTFVDFYGDAASVTAKVVPVLGNAVSHIVHGATGTVMLPASRRFDSDLVSGIAEFEVPHADAPGWLDPSGQTVSHWKYVVTVTATLNKGFGRSLTWTKEVQPLVGQTEIDLDLVPSAEVSGPISTVPAAVLSLNGQTGHVIFSGDGATDAALAANLDASKAYTDDAAQDVRSELDTAVMRSTAEGIPETAWRQTTDDGRYLPLGYGTDGHLDEFARTIFKADISGVEDIGIHPKYARAGITDDGTNRLLWGIRWDGSVEIPGLTGVIAEAPEAAEATAAPVYTDAPYTPGAGVLPVYARNAVIAGWGSSSMGGIGFVMNTMATRLGASTYLSEGKGGERVEHIAARLGSRPALLAPTGGSIPASGSVLVDSSNMNTTNSSLKTYSGVWAGIPGTLSWDTTALALRFTRTTAGDAVPITGEMPFIPTTGETNRDAVTLLWMGKNNTSTTNAAPFVIDVTDKAHDWLAPLHKRALVLGHFINTNVGAVNVQRTNVNEINAAHARRYGRTFVDVQAYITSPQVWTDSGITPTQADLDAQAAQVKPPSLSSDDGHFNSAGYYAVGGIIEARINDLGWY